MTDHQTPRVANTGHDGYSQGGGPQGPGPARQGGNMTDQPRILGGRYEIGRIIGRGGMALVTQARDLRLGRDVAVKELRTDLASDPTFQARFRREAQAAAGLNHPNIVSVYDTGEEVGPQTQARVPFIVMELVEGRTLRDILRDGRKILPQRALEFTAGVLEALAYSHRAGIIHRDIKPANVMLTSSGMVKVMDFGIARAVADTSSTMTQTAAVIGTAQYLSPEQARGETVDTRSDLYSTGCLMYELLVGQPPFQGDSPVSVAYQHVRELPVPPSQVDPEITAAMDAVVLKALAKDPDDRYATAGEMRDDVNRILGGQRVSATLPPPVPPLVAAGASAAAATAVLPADRTMGDGEAVATGSMAPLPPERRNRAGLWWTLAIVALLLVGLVAGWQLLLRNNEPAVKQVEVPPLINLTQAQAEAELAKVELVPRFVREETPDATSIDRVLRTDPIAGTTVPEGSEVQVVVNAGPKMVTVPEGLLGMREEDALRFLKMAGLTGHSVEAEDEPADAVAGTVIKVTPAVGQSIPATQVVTLTVATGKSRLPSMVGMTRQQAIDEAAKYGFTNLVFEPADGTTVIRTDPQALSLVDRSTKVTVYMEAPKPTPTPTPPPTQPPATASARPTPSASATP